MNVIDARCGCHACEERTQDIYRMVGRCSNCGADALLIIYRAGDKKSDQDCPVCGAVYTVRSGSQRLATPDEIPASPVPAVADDPEAKPGLDLGAPGHVDCDCMDCRPWTS